ncbi:MAG: hypothetical protein J6N49_05680 [Alphaproteobacteria bacterium]|nr:hypothetical protein [Alphaproteobacteria bacterium]
MITFLAVKTNKGHIALCEEGERDFATVIASANGEKCKALHVFKREEIVDGKQAMFRVTPGMLIVKAHYSKRLQDVCVKAYEVCKVYVDEHNMAGVDAEFKCERIGGSWTTPPPVDLTEAADAAAEKLKMRGKGKAIFVRWTVSHPYKH